MRLGCDRDGQVVEDRAEWGMGIGIRFRALTPSPIGSLSSAGGRHMDSRSGSVSYYRAILEERCLFSEF